MSKKSDVSRDCLEPFLTVAQVAKALNVSRQTVYTYIYHEGLPSITIRGIRRIHYESLERWMCQREEVYGRKATGA